MVIEDIASVFLPLSDGSKGQVRLGVLKCPFLVYGYLLLCNKLPLPLTCISFFMVSEDFFSVSCKTYLISNNWFPESSSYLSLCSRHPGYSCLSSFEEMLFSGWDTSALFLCLHDKCLWTKPNSSLCRVSLHSLL